MRVASATLHEPAQYNPLYIHASVGLGKTHLIQAIAQSALSTGQRTIYLTAEKFMYGFVSALRAHTAIAYKERLRSIDKLIIDDVQFLRGQIDPAGVLPHAERADRRRQAGRDCGRPAAIRTRKSR